MENDTAAQKNLFAQLCGAATEDRELSHGLIIQFAEDPEKLTGNMIFEGTNAVLLGSRKPSAFFRALAEAHRLEDLFPAVAAMRGVVQNPVYHPEGDVYEHTMLVLDCAAELRDRAEHQLPFMYSALLHDAGKCVCTEIREDGKITAYGHEVLGDAIIRDQLNALTDDPFLTEYVLNQTHLHMRPNMLYDAQSKKKKTRMLFDLSVCPNDLILLSRADATGKLDEPYDTGAERWLRERLKDYHERAVCPMAERGDLEAAAAEAGADIDAVMRRARMLHFSGIDRRRAVKQIMDEIMHNTF